ncbi:class I SAM-dependent methyltransferase [Paraburkholderia sp. G-4-1-8]|uniref:Class I SAM-dependent methyltransferase n=2 Tax=Paraburkholderia antibiotica TaxID=2728839 RepID=A0A7Y0A1U8_9BURK|nr:class I SAM-dependent methyltransferase [Paraburkholderia antibiotica]
MPSAPIHPNDDMFHGSIEHYDSVGSQMAEFGRRAAELAGDAEPRILELPCGYGRVTRKLLDHFDPGRIHVADIMVPAVDFCTSTFGVHGHYVVDPVYEFRNIESSNFDVALLGSLITHLSQVNARSVMNHFFTKLRRGGVAVVTTHGEKSREHLGGSDIYQVGDAARQHLLAAYDANEYGFVNYRADHSLEAKTVDYIGNSYGIAMIPTDWVKDVCRENELTIIEHRPGGWDNHQDVFFIRR